MPETPRRGPPPFKFTGSIGAAGVFILLLLVGFGYQSLQEARERQRLERLPKTVNLRGPIAAKEGIASVTRIARLWQADVRLQAIFTAFAANPQGKTPAMGSDGKPVPPHGWTYRFFSASQGWFLDLILRPDGRCESSSFNGVNYLDSQPLPEGFIDSGAALVIAEDLYGRKYQGEGKLFQRTARLTTWRRNVVGPADPIPHRATWQIEYMTMRHRKRVDLHLMLDALTGKELCAVEFADNQVEVLTNHYRNPDRQPPRD